MKFHPGRKTYLAGGVLLLLSVILYFSGPARELPLLPRLHYNAVFMLTPCVSRTAAYSEDGISFHYLIPGKLLRFPERSDPSLTHHPMPVSATLETAINTEVMDIPLQPSNKYWRIGAGASVSNSSGPALLPGFARDVGYEKSRPSISRGQILLRREGLAGGNGEYEFLYTYGDNGRFFRIAMPRYPARRHKNSWFHQAAYNSRLLPLDMMEGPQPGFLRWFLRPGAEKMEYCSGKLIRETIVYSGGRTAVK